MGFGVLLLIQDENPLEGLLGAKNKRKSKGLSQDFSAQ